MKYVCILCVLRFCVLCMCLCVVCMCLCVVCMCLCVVCVCLCVVCMCAHTYKYLMLEHSDTLSPGVQNYEAFEQWKALLLLVSQCEEAVDKRPDFFADVVRASRMTCAVLCIGQKMKLCMLFYGKNPEVYKGNMCIRRP